MDRDLILHRAINTYGVKAQTDMAIEEMAELIKALCKISRAEDATELKAAGENVIEEIADVQIMLDQLKMIYGESTDMEAKKLERLADRLKSGKKL